MNQELAHVLYEILVVLGASMAVLVLCSRLRVPTVVGLILTGIVIGPGGLRLVSDRHMVELFAEVGVVLLLFTIGLELSLAKLNRARRAFLVGGPVQALLTAAVTVGVALVLGLDVRQAVFVAFLVVLSSTAVVLKIYNERQEIRTPHGEASLGVLVFQDFLVVPMVVVTPILAGTGESDWAGLATRLGGALIAATAAFFLARVLLPPVLKTLAGTGAREAFLLGALFLGLGMAYLTGVLGLSPALGAFLAGVAAAESKYRYQLMADVGPFRDVFTSLFFVSIGMLVVVPEGAGRAGAVVGLALGIVVVKTITGYFAVRAAGFVPRTAMSASLGLAQLGEFSFLLMAIGVSHRLLPQAAQEALLAAAVLTLLLTPLAILVAPSLAQRLRGGSPIQEDSERSNHVILVGYGLTSKLLAEVLKEARIAYRVVELSTEASDRARTDGHPVLYGDATRPEILGAVGIERARALVVSISDARAQRRIISLARSMNPKLRITTVAKRVDEIVQISSLGANRVVAVEFESALEVLHDILETFHVPRNIIRAQTRALRGEKYRMMRAPKLSEGVNDAVLDALTEAATEVARLISGSPAVGQTLRGLDLRKQTGASVIAVVRDSKSINNPSPDLELFVGDDLVLVGSHEEVDGALLLLRPGEVEEEDAL